jgi:hypothetical protein
MNNVTQFMFDNDEVRSLLINSQPWFVLADVLRAFKSTTRPSDAKESVIDTFGQDVVNDYPLQTTGGEQNVLFIPYYAVTFLLTRSKTETGKRMNQWIHKEILPSIFQTGQYKFNTYTVTPQPNLLAIERSKHYQKQFEALESSSLTKPIKTLLTKHLKRELDNCLVFTDSQNYDKYRWEEILVHFAQHIEILLEQGSVGDWNCRKVKKIDDTGVVRHYLAVIVYQAEGGIWPVFKELCGDVPYYNVSIKDLAEMLGAGYDYEQFQVRRGSLEWEKKRCVMLPIYTDFSQCILPELKEQLTLKPSILK